MSDTLSGHLLTSNDSSVVTPNDPAVSAYYAQLTGTVTGTTPYGFSTAASMTALQNTVNQLLTDLSVIKNLISAT
jgi:hypothetical protein